MTQTGIREFVTFRVDGQWLGVPVATVQEVLLAQRMAVVPLAPAEVAGFLNLRGQIVTALDLRTRLDMPGEPRLADAMNVVVRHDGELFSLLVDDVGDVLAIDAEQLEPVPLTLDAGWRAVSSGIVRRDTNLLAVLDVGALLRLDTLATT
ncbi:MAG: chemotaxis protein CheW [Gemmatimonadetes bacterium]|nr:chemotaxis protein CheW [Gemmatimonadota bacterium]